MLLSGCLSLVPLLLIDAACVCAYVCVCVLQFQGVVLQNGKLQKYWIGKQTAASYLTKAKAAVGSMKPLDIQTLQEKYALLQKVKSL